MLVAGAATGRSWSALGDSNLSDGLKVCCSDPGAVSARQHGLYNPGDRRTVSQQVHQTPERCGWSLGPQAHQFTGFRTRSNIRAPQGATVWKSEATKLPTTSSPTLRISPACSSSPRTSHRGGGRDRTIRQQVRSEGEHARRGYAAGGRVAGERQPHRTATIRWRSSSGRRRWPMTPGNSNSCGSTAYNSRTGRKHSTGITRRPRWCGNTCRTELDISPRSD